MRKNILLIVLLANHCALVLTQGGFFSSGFWSNSCDKYLSIQNDYYSKWGLLTVPNPRSNKVEVQIISTLAAELPTVSKSIEILSSGRATVGFISDIVRRGCRLFYYNSYNY